MEARSALAFALFALVLASCGYRPAARLNDDVHRSAWIPAFESRIAYPELDVYAASYLGTRLTSLGLHAVNAAERADVTVQGVLLGVSEQPVALGDAQTLVELVLDVRIDVDRLGGDGACATRVAHGRSAQVVPLDAISEGERSTALQTAAQQAIDDLVLEVLLCAREASEEN